MEFLISTPTQLTHALRSVRRARGLSQGETGKLVGLLPKTISALENRPGSTTLDSFLKLLSALDLELIIVPKEEHDSTVRDIDPASEEW